MEVESFDLGVLGIADLPAGDQSYGSMFASLDWEGPSDSFMDIDASALDLSTIIGLPTIDNEAVTEDHTDGGAPQPPNSIKTNGDTLPDGDKATPASSSLSTATASDQRQIELIGEIDHIESSIRDHELQGSQPGEISTLKLQKTRLWLELKRLRNPDGVRDRRLVSLEFDEASLLLDLLKTGRSSAELEEDEDYHQLMAQKIRLKKELGGLERQRQDITADNTMQQPTATVSEPQQPTQNLPIGPLENQQSHHVTSNDTGRPKNMEIAGSASDINPASPQGAPERVSNSQKVEGRQNGIPCDSLSTMDRANKKFKLSGKQVQNRKEVGAAGGVCLNCRKDRSKPACQGKEICSRCVAAGLADCIRPTLKDKNVFSYRIDLIHEPTPSSPAPAKTKKAFVAAIIRDFFDISGHPLIKPRAEVLSLLDKLYADLIRLSFDAEVCMGRLAALRGSCAFNIFVKSNTIINNRHLPYVDHGMEGHFKESVEIEIVYSIGAALEKFEDEFQKKLEAKKSDYIRQLEVLRAVSSGYVFLVMDEFLRESNIRECRGANNLPKQASLLAILGLTLEQVLDFADDAIRSNTLHEDLKTMLRHLGLVLLSYLEPPSPLAFPEQTEYNKCFGENRTHVTGVFMDDLFWYELYMASSKAIPAHLLQVRDLEKVNPVPPTAPPVSVPKPAGRSVRPPSIKDVRVEYGNQMEAITRPYMGMNLSLRSPTTNSVNSVDDIEVEASTFTTPHPFRATTIPVRATNFDDQTELFASTISDEKEQEKQPQSWWNKLRKRERH